MPIEIPLAQQVYTADVRGPSEPTPIRRPHSIRRTSTIDMTWPDGIPGEVHCVGRCRDLRTGASPDEAEVVDQATVIADITSERVYTSIQSVPERPALQGIVGARGGGGSRSRMGVLIADDKEQASPLYLLMDDLPAAGLVSGHISAEWVQPEDRRRPLHMVPGSMDGICAGHVENASAHDPAGGIFMIHQVRPVQPLDRADDPIGWHEHAPDVVEPSMRRARRIDAWIDGQEIRVDAFFQDTAMTPGGVRVAVHEYCILAAASLADGQLTELFVDPRVLPFDECPNAVRNTRRMLGKPLGDFRGTVIPTLPGTDGCTHLNDMLRALAEVPRLVQAFEA